MSAGTNHNRFNRGRAHAFAQLKDPRGSQFDVLVDKKTLVAVRDSKTFLARYFKYKYSGWKLHHCDDALGFLRLFHSSWLWPQVRKRMRSEGFVWSWK